jgi:hypothetical protein
MKAKLCALFIVLSTFSTGCDNSNEDVTKTVDKNGSVETAVQITHLDNDYDLLITTHKVWVKQNIYKTVEYRDTIPSLVNELRPQSAEADTKDAREKKDYEIYITVK